VAVSACPSRARIVAALAFVVLAIACSPLAAPASPRDAELSGLSCAACHTAGAQLTPIGSAWAARSNRLEPIGGIPLISMKASFAYVSDGNGPGLSKVILDYLDLYVNGKFASNLSYVVEQHVVDGGAPGLNRDAFVQWRRPHSRYLAGAMALPLLTDPECFRPLDEDYLMDDQTVGNNPFALINSQVMAGVYTGDAVRGLEVGTFAVAGHEAGSGVPQTGTDSLFSATQRMPDLALSAIRYDGTRVLGSVPDRFWRSSFGLVADRGPWRLDLAFTQGRDSDPGTGSGVGSAGGLAQLHLDLKSGTFFEARYEGITDTTGIFVRQAVIGGGRTIVQHVRVTIEDGIARDTRTHNVLHFVTSFGANNARVGNGSY
jgi:hypothetical protein